MACLVPPVLRRTSIPTPTWPEMNSVGAFTDARIGCGRPQLFRDGFETLSSHSPITSELQPAAPSLRAPAHRALYSERSCPQSLFALGTRAPARSHAMHNSHERRFLLAADIGEIGFRNGLTVKAVALRMPHASFLRQLWFLSRSAPPA